MKKKTDGGRSVFHYAFAGKPVAAGLSLLLACAAIGTSFIALEDVSADEEYKPLAAVAVTAEPLVATAVTAQTVSKAEPLKASPVEAKPLVATAVTAPETETKQIEPLEAAPLIPEVKRPDSYVNDYLGFTRTDLVSYLVENADQYLGTPYKEETVAPVLGKNGHMQCEGFIWDVMLAVATQNENDIPCGNILTEPANGGGWVNWSYYHNVDPITFNTKDEMLASGVLEKGDVIWSFDYAGPYGLSNSNHVGFFWGDDPHDDKFWESAMKTGTEVYAGSADGNRIAGIEAMSPAPSVWWVFKLSPDTAYESGTWAGLPAAGTAGAALEDGKEENADPDGAKEEAVTEQAAAAEAEPGSGDTPDTDAAKDVEESQTGTDTQDAGSMQGITAVSETFAEDAEEQTMFTEEDSAYEADIVSTSYESKGSEGMIFYNGQDTDTGYYANFSTIGG